jgi:hypothetical protein
VRSEEEVALVLELVRARWNDCEIARETGIPRGTVRGWRIGRTPNFSRQLGNCALCSGNAEALPLPAYPYLLGLYLGDGCITACPRNVYKLRIVCAARYPDLPAVRACDGGGSPEQGWPDQGLYATKRGERPRSPAVR